MHAKSLQLCLTLWPHGLWPVRLLGPWILQARILEWVCQALLQGIFPTRGSNPLPFPALGGRFFTTSATREALQASTLQVISCCSECILLFSKTFSLLMWTTLFFFPLSLYWICYSIASVFMFCFFGPGACGILTHWPGIYPTSPVLKGEVLTTGLPEKSLGCILNYFWVKILALGK